VNLDELAYFSLKPCRHPADKKAGRDRFDPGSEKPVRHFQIPCYGRVWVLAWLGSKLKVEAPLVQSDAIMVLDGGEGANRLLAPDLPKAREFCFEENFVRDLLKELYS
jgi:hypothetical protein